MNAQGDEFAAETPRLSALVAAGVEFTPGSDGEGRFTHLVGVREWPAMGQADVVLIFSQTDAVASRGDHDGGVLWECEGTALDVANALLELPTPGTALAPRLARPGPSLVARRRPVMTSGDIPAPECL
ncbi:hypothetical protein CFN78_17005 [Amycolatopsis antarctica]|uniref:Uncharacterized protein n=1 Tax=Amycolatopsis antarctica TaxID=1854586 RepID=A0A263D434_9PSEU|nr:hypothetical protein [Amycolatopsis antarctica]OZM72216.1 hypothetical protein CFN78_17005 [Amycolatopsis antarctica]